MLRYLLRFLFYFLTCIYNVAQRGNLASQLVGCDEEGIDLLSRMLAFDPSRRCTAEEALAHNYVSCPPPLKVLEVPCLLPLAF